MSEIKGKIIHIGQTETVGNAFKKRQVVVETAETYPQRISIDFVQDKTSLLDQFQVGNEVSVSVNIRGNAFNGKWYVNLSGWRISKVTDNTNQSAVDGYQAKEMPKMPSASDFGTEFKDEDHDDLPF